MPESSKDWLKASLRQTRELLESLPHAKKVALENHAKFREAAQELRG